MSREGLLNVKAAEKASNVSTSSHMSIYNTEFDETGKTWEDIEDEDDRIMHLEFPIESLLLMTL